MSAAPYLLGLLQGVASSVCPTLSADSVIAAVQQSSAFEESVAIVQHSDAWGITDEELRDSICGTLESWSEPLLGGHTLVRYLAFAGVEHTFAHFGVSGDEVHLLNRVGDSTLAGGIDIERWNQFIDAGLALTTDSLVVDYAWLVAALHENYPNRPAPFCAEDTLSMQPANDGDKAKEIFFGWLFATVAVDNAGRVLSISVDIPATCN